MLLDAEHVFKYQNKYIATLILKMSSVELLDCTLRDGGYVNNWEFTNEQAVILYNTLAKNNVDIIEVGFRTTQNPEYLKKYGRFFFCDDALLDSVFEGVDIENGPKIAVMCQIGMSTLSDFAPKEQSKLSIVRVLLAYHSVKGTNDNEIDYDMLNEGCELINGLVSLGYSVSINIGRIDKPSDEQLREICEILSRTGMQYFYMADTYGSTDLFSTEHYVKLIKSYFHDDFNRPDIKIGFHAHNNNKNAVYKALYAVKCGSSAGVSRSCIKLLMAVCMDLGVDQEMLQQNF